MELVISLVALIISLASVVITYIIAYRCKNREEEIIHEINHASFRAVETGVPKRIPLPSLPKNSPNGVRLKPRGSHETDPFKEQDN